MMRFLLLIVTVLLCMLSITSAQKTVEELEVLSDQELEAICRNLGLALIDTDEAGNKLSLSHADYVEAARQCLEVQDQMEEIMAENPELMKEYTAERDRMMAAEKTENERLLKEKERLEAEIAAAGGDGASSKGGAFGVKKDSKPEAPSEPVVEASSGSSASESASAEPAEPEEDVGADLVSEILEESSAPVLNLPKPLQDAIDKVWPQLKSKLKLPPAVMEKVDMVLPKPTRVLIGKVLIRIRDDGLQLLKFLHRQGKALLGKIIEKLEERKAAKAAEASAAQ